VIFIAGREILMDTLDLEGDRRTGARTIPVAFGSVRSVHVAFSLLLMAVGLAGAVQLSQGSTGRALATVTLAPCIALMLVVWKRTTPAMRQRMVLLLWVPLVSGALLLLG
jgi:4-hydroxybenzoate polyprenyltransferase